MGGLAGFVGQTIADDPTISSRKLLAPVMPRRGTDIEVRTLGRSWLATLSAHDTSIWGDDTVIVAVHGAIDDLADLRALENGGRIQVGSSPAETIGRLLKGRSVEDLATQLRGAFTVLVSDGESIQVIRDHIGVRPIFIRDGGNRWTVATEAKQLLAVMNHAEPNLAYLRELLFGGDSGATVAFHGIDRAPRAATTRLVPGEKAASTRYWDPEKFLESSDIRDPEEAAERLRDLIARAVKRTVTGNDILALSGGLDSTTIAAFAADAHFEASGGQRLKAVSAVYPDHPSVDESDLIAIVARYKDLESHTFELKAKPLDDLAMWVDLLDGPGYTPSVPEILEMYQVAADLGATTIITGELAEYVFALRYQTLGHMIWNRRWSGVRNHIFYEREEGRGWMSLGREIARSLAPSSALHLWSQRKGRTALPPWVSTSALPWFSDPRRIPPVGQRWPTLQLQPIAGDHAVSFDDVDVASSIPGIAVRHPLVDRDLWEFVLSLRAEVKNPTPQAKSLMRAAMSGLLPDEIVERRNKTFFDEAGLDKTDNSAIARWVSTGDYRFEGIDYELLQSRLESGEMSLVELDWAKNLTRCHAFLARWQ